MVTQRRMM
jgi:hypothetical protein